MKLKRFEYKNDGKAELTLDIGSLTLVVSAPVTVEITGDAVDTVPDEELQIAVDRLLSQMVLDMMAMARTKREGK